jgi:peptide-methionine (S)-S-oxide reductase
MSAFHEAVAAIDAGDVEALRRLLAANPELVHERLEEPAEGYFARPYLLWHIAENPVRNDRLPRNIADVTRTIIEAGAPRDQLDYTLELVASGRVPREAGVQLELIDLLTSCGADPDTAMPSCLGHKEIAAATRLLERGAKVTLLVAVCFDRKEQAKALLKTASSHDKQVALLAAAFYGHADLARMLLDAGADVNQFGPKGFHAHSTPLHQAVYAGSLDTVKALVAAGARLDVADRVYGSTPLGWAEYCKKPEIAEYLRGLASC